jgi:hypothetical protein
MAVNRAAANAAKAGVPIEQAQQVVNAYRDTVGVNATALEASAAVKASTDVLREALVDARAGAQAANDEKWQVK